MHTGHAGNYLDAMQGTIDRLTVENARLREERDAERARITAAVAEERERCAAVISVAATEAAANGAALNYEGLWHLAGRIAYPPDAPPRPSST